MSCMSIPELIVKKRDGEPLSDYEIQHFVNAVVDKSIQDSQLGAMLMAIVLKGMDERETTSLTRSMIHSGETLQWPDDWRPIMVDKHSTGGVGDKVSLPLAPALAACGVKVPMISGRGLGLTMGTLDKLEAIPGFTVSQSQDNMKSILRDVGCCIVGQTDTLVPADKLMYATRDVTGTVESLPLITASIISKKAAENISALILDVKYGKGGSIKSMENAQNIANMMATIGKGLGVRTTAVISDMSMPLGKAVGHALEVIEACECLRGKGPQSLRHLVTTLGGNLLHDVGKAESVDDGVLKIARALDDGSALATWGQMLQRQGVAASVVEVLCSPQPAYHTVLPTAKHQTKLQTKHEGYVREIDARVCAQVCQHLGAGRSRKGQQLDLAAGLTMNVETGDYLRAGDTWVTVHHNKELLASDVTALNDALLLQTVSYHNDVIKDTIKP